MLEVSWLAFYMLLHWGLSLLLWPLRAWSHRLGNQHAAQLVKLWGCAAALLLLVPLLLLQPWALESKVLPWFHQGLVQVIHSAPTEAVTSNPATSTVIRLQTWPLSSQLLYLLAPSFWFWLLIPLISVLKIFHLWRSYRALHQLRREATPWQLPAPLAQTSCALPVSLHPEIQSAMLVGWRRPEILMPPSYPARLSNSQLECVVRHEHSHLQHGDLKAFVLQQLLSCWLWWSPGWRLVCTELTRWREVRCDLTVAAAMGSSHQYAQTLLDCATVHTKADGVTSQLAQRWQQNSLLALRIDAVLQNAPLTARSWRAFAVGTVAMLLSCLFLAHHWQLAQLPARHAQLRLSQLQPLSALLKAVEHGDRVRVQALLDAGAPLNIAMPGRGSPLMVAVRRADYPMVELLLQRGADVQISSRGDGNALIIAVQLGDLTMAQKLLDAGADVNAAVLADETALINAASNNDFAMLQLLLQRGADINLQVETPLADGPEMRSALNRATDPTLIQWLRERGAR